jgi:hypothetical protein
MMKAKLPRFGLCLVLLGGLTGLTACGDKKSQSTVPSRPVTNARLQILEPTPNQETGPDVTVKVGLTGAKEVQPAQGDVKPDEGHIHIVLDGQIVAMAYGTQQDLHGLKPGKHSLQADFVAIDHLPFQNRVLAAVIFSVKQ